MAEKRISLFETRVHEIIQETPDTVTLVLDTLGHDRDYLAGQFVSIPPGQFKHLGQTIAFLEKLKGRRELVRAYSMASIPDEPHLAITIKEEPYEPGSTEYPCLLSPWLVYGVRPGDRMTVQGYSGAYVLPDKLSEHTDHVVHLVAGSGVVPNYAMVKWALAHEPKVRHTFVYSNKTHDDVIFGRQLAEMQAAHPARLRLVHCLTREKDVPASMPGCHLGRVNLEVLKEAIGDPNACLAFACGPALTRWDKKAAREKGEEPKPRFLESLRELLTELGLPRERLHQEAYG